MGVNKLTKRPLRRRSTSKKLSDRRLLLESLEARQLLAGPDLIAIRPDAGSLLRDGDTLNIAPREFNLLFAGGANLRESTINANTVKLTRAGTDGVLGTADDINVALGFVGLVNPGSTSPEDLTRVVLRPASSAAFNVNDATSQFPDDEYRIQIIGASSPALTNLANQAFNNGVNESVSFRLDRGAQVVSVVPQPVSRNTQRVTLGGGVSGGTYRLTFNGQTTAPINHNATNATIQTALEALPNVQPGDIKMGGVREVTFQGQFAGEQVPLMTINSTALVGGTGSVVRLTTLSQASNQIVVYLDNQAIDGAEVIDPKFYRLINTSGTLATGDDSTLLPASVTYVRADNSVVLTFAADIPEGNYRLDIGDSGGDNSTLAGAVQVGTVSGSSPFSSNSFLGDFGGTSNNPADVDLYNMQIVVPGGPATVLTVTVAPQAGFKAKVEFLDSAGALLTSMTQAAGTPVVLNPTITTTGTYFVRVTSDDGSTGSYSINASVVGSPISNSDANTTVGTATSLGTLGAAGITISSQIERQSIPLPPLPGGEDDPGHRTIQREAHIGSTGTTATVPQAIRQVRYYFPNTLGSSYTNLISVPEKQIVRDIFEILAQQSGYEFIESPATNPGGDQLMIGKGDLRSLDPTIGPNAGVAGLGGASAVVLNGAIYNQANRFYGDGFTDVMYHEILHALGLGHAYDQPATMSSIALPNDVQPGDVDIIHLQRIVPPNSTDIDMYRFDLASTGKFTAETFAERLASPSLLNTVLTLYRQIAGGDIELVARNDQYFGADSFIELELTPGTYFIGVTSTGNTAYDPRVPDSGFGGTTAGAYQLKLGFSADRDGSLRDVSGTSIDGDADGNAGGVHSFWFQASDPASTLYVDKLADTIANMPQGTGAITTPFDEIDSALLAAGNRIVIPTNATAAALNGQTFVIDDGVNLALFNFGTTGANPVDLTAATTPGQIATAIQNAVNAAKSAGTPRLVSTVGVSVAGRVVQLTGIKNLALTGSPTLLATPNLVKIVGNGGADQSINTLSDNRPYLIGLDTSGNPLEDGSEFLVPQGVNVMIHAGALFKMRTANLDAGTSSTDANRSQSSIQVLGTPNNSVFLRSYHDDTVGGNSDGVGPNPGPGNFGGIVFRDDSDLEGRGIFLNYVNHVDIKNGGGKVFVGANESVFSPIHIVDARPTVSFNRITNSDDAAVSASPDSFEDSLGRIGPDVHGNSLSGNTFNAMFIRVETVIGGLKKLSSSSRLNDTDITHVLNENLIIAGGAGGPVLQTTTGPLVARASGRLVVDPGIVLKLNKAVIQVERGGGSLIAEGTVDRPVVFTSIKDDRFGGSGSFDANGSTNAPARGDWSGLFFGEATSGSIDNAIIAYAGGTSNTSGAAFNAVEVHQADLRIANTLLQNNASGAAAGVRGGLGANASAVIYVTGAQPIIVNNTIVDNSAPAINIGANSLRFENVRDSGRSRGLAEPFDEFADNHGPLVRINRLENNSTNGMLVRGERLTIESIWDDTDIVHVLQSLVTVDNLHTYGGLTLQSSNSESLVVKLSGGNAGFTATGTPVEIIDRIGGTIHVLGTVGHPVILTHIADDTVGAGFTPTGEVIKNTNNSVTPSTGVSGGWRGFVFDEFSNDRNVAIVRELENPLTNKTDVNANPTLSQPIGTLAPNEKSGDENRRLGFKVKGFISPNDPNDVDVYSFKGTAGTPVWIDVDRTDTALDAIVEVVSLAGTVLARSQRSGNVGAAGDVNAPTLIQNPLLGGDYFTQNFRDPGFYYVLPGTAGSVGTYYVRVRSNPASVGNVATIAGESRGAYQLQIRLNQVDEFPGSTVQFADIRFAQTGIDVRGLPAHSPLIAEASEVFAGDGADINDTFGNATTLVNLLQSDVAAIGLSGALRNANDVDWYSFDVRQTGVQVIGGVNDSAGTVAVVLDIDYADNAVRGDTTVAVYDQNQNLIYIGRESNIADDQPSNPLDPNTAVKDLSRGSLGKKDPYIGPIHVLPGSTYYVAVMSDRQLPSALMGVFEATPVNTQNALVRLEPVNSLIRIVEDHIGLQGYSSRGVPIVPSTPAGLFDISTGVIASGVGVDASVTPFNLQNVALYVATDRPETDTALGSDDKLYTVDPFESNRWLTRVNVSDSFVAGVNDIQDLVMRSDGRFFGYQRLNGNTGSVGALVEIDPSSGAIIAGSTQNDNIRDRGTTPNVSLLNTNLGGANARAEQFTISDEVDALTFERRGQTAPATAPVPTYETYFSVRESDSASKLYRGRENGDTTAAIASGSNQQYGVMGDIQPSYFVRTVTFDDGVDITTVELGSTTGLGFTVTLTRNAGATGVTTSNVTSRTATINLSTTTLPTAQDLVDLVNTDPNVSLFLRASVSAGINTNPGTTTSPAAAALAGISTKVANASITLFVNNSATPPDRTNIRIESKLPGNAGNSININITRPNNTNANIFSVVGNTINLEIGGTGAPISAAPTAGAIVDAINNDPNASRLVTAVIVGGNGANGTGANGTAALGLSFIGLNPLTGGSSDVTRTPLSGRVTGLSFGNFDSTGNLFGVTNAGEFLEINKNSGNVIRRLDVNAALASIGLPTVNFQGLSLGPQNVENGIYRQTLFAVTNNGSLYAFDSTLISGVTNGTDPAQVLGVMRNVFAATANIGFSNGVGGTATVNLTSSSSAPFAITITRNAAATAVVAADAIARTATINLNTAPSPTAQAFRDLINANPVLNQFLIARITAGAGTVIGSAAPLATTFSSSSITSLASGMVTGNATPIGLAFSPLDFNLWHPTTRRGNDSGHGVNAASDATRTPGTENLTYSTVGSTRDSNQRAGGVSWQFGFEPWLQNQNVNTTSYLVYNAGVNAQYGILTTAIHQDLSSNASLLQNQSGAITGTYNFPAGALGSLTTKSFDLAGSVATDRPTLYFNYFLDTEAHAGSNVGSDGNTPFRDSARVFISKDGGITWELLASNNSQLSSADPTITNSTAELPGFLSHLSDAGLNSATQRVQNRQIVQELMDNSGQWRQARVDLSTFAGLTGLLLRVDFSSAGSMNDASLVRIDGKLNPLAPGDAAPFGEFQANSNTPRSIRSLSNAFEGFYVDDFIIGYAERGEMVTGTVSDSSITNLFAGGARTRDNDPNQFPDIVNGPYQLEVRRTDEYQTLTPPGPVIGTIYDTNDRHVNDVSQAALVTFEGATAFPPTGPFPATILGNVIPAIAIAPWATSTTNPFTGSQSLASGAVSKTDAPPKLLSIYQATLTDLVVPTTSAGVIEFSYSVSSLQDKHGLRFLIDGVPQNLTILNPDFPLSDTTLASGDLGYRTVRFSFSAGQHLFQWVYDFRDAALPSGLNKAFIDDVRILQGGTGLLADRNRQRAQGVFVIDSNFITDSSIVGVNVAPGATQGGGSVPHPGSTINFPQLNSDRLVPGVVIQNNLIAGSSGIRYAGESSANPQRPVPLGKIVNNTLIGDNRTGVGIDVIGLASPTLLNNLLTNLGTGIQNNGTGTVIRSNFFQNNAANGSTGTSAITASALTPLFVDAANRNYYLSPGSQAIDSSQDIEPDRANFITFKTSLGIPDSPSNAPNRDVYGQLRVDSSGSGGGTGSSVFKDRGAVDRSDKDQPFAVLLNPVDNDAAGSDRDPNATVVHLTNPLLENFKILLGDGRGPSSPFEGTGVNGLTVDDPNNVTVSQTAVKIVHDGRLLVENVDYTLGYNTQSGVLFLTPLSTLWEQTGVYTITLDNTQIVDLAGNRLRSNQSDGSTKFFILMPDVRLDYGDAPDSFKTLLVSNPARHTIQPGATPRLGARVDGEQDGSIPLADDTAQNVMLSSPTASALFTIATTLTGQTVDINSLPVGGEQLSVTIGLDSATFEFVAPGFAAKRGNVAVRLIVGDTPASVATRLANSIRSRLVQQGNASVVAIDTLVPTTITVDTFDDEDGVSIGKFNAGGPDYVVFLKPGVPELTMDPADVLGFLNPLDELGTTVSINAGIAGKLDAWIDFNGDGAFNPTEQIFTNQPLSVGDNTLRIITPLGSADGLRWARFRISEQGNLGPTELAIGGEVEDYEIQVINIPPTIPMDDSFDVLEDNVLDTTDTLLFPNTLFSNDSPTGFLPPRFIVNNQPTKGTLTVTDPLSGRFVYTPATDFYGKDTFTYWVSTQPLPGTTLPPNVQLATVTINVAPVNDEPRGQNHVFPVLEDTAITITSTQLLNGAVGHGNPQYPSGAPAFPWNESNQDLTLKIIALEIDGTPITSATMSPFVTTRGSYALTFTGADFTQLMFTPNQDLNRDNLRLSTDPVIYETFKYTIEDDGNSIDPADNVTVIPGTPLTNEATVSIDIRPVNDPPVATGDIISENNPDWLAYNGVVLPTAALTPTEDTDFSIPFAYVLRNDFNARPTALDELTLANGLLNDGAITVTAVGVSDLGATVSVDVGAQTIKYRAPANAYGIDRFVYTITDTGITEDIAGVRTANPLTTTATITILVKPINDEPLAKDEQFTDSEYQELENISGNTNPIAKSEGNGFFTIFASELLSLGLADGALESTFSNGLSELFDEFQQDLRVVGFGLPGDLTPTVDAASLVYDAFGVATTTLTTASGTIVFTFKLDGTGVGALDNLVYTPNTDYNDNPQFPANDKFVYFVEDFGEIDVYGGDTLPAEDLLSVNHGSLRSAPATITLTVTPTNDIPILPNFGRVELVEDLKDNTVDAIGVLFPVGTVNPDNGQLVYDIFPNAADVILPGALTALDEQALQTFTITVTPSNVPAGMFAVLDPLGAPGVIATLTADGLLTLQPNPDVFGVAVLKITVTDNGLNALGNPDPKTVERLITINIAPVNDQPVTTDRQLTLSEVEEFNNGTGAANGNVAILTITPESLLRQSTGIVSTPANANNPSRESDFATGSNTLYDEHLQNLRVVEFSFTDSTNATVTVTRANSGTVYTTNTGATLRFDFDASGAFTGGEYRPRVDFNRLSQFTPNPDMFTYIVEDFGVDTIPGTAFINSPNPADQIDYTVDGLGAGINNRSLPSTVTITVTEVNDAPLFPAFGQVDLTEDELADNVPVVRDIYIDPLVLIRPSQTTALDELARQGVTITFTPVNSIAVIGMPQSMFSAFPTLLVNGTLTLRPLPDAFGIAVYDVTVTDNGRNAAGSPDPRSVTRRMTISIAPVNDMPVAFNRSLTVDEVVERDTATPAVLDFAADDLLRDTAAYGVRDAEGNFPSTLDPLYNEREQTLRVVRFIIPGASDIDAALDEGTTLVGGNGFATRTTLNGGTLRFNFVNGAFTTGTYTPAVDYNERTPFNATDPFSYIIEDDGVATIPGSAFVNGGAPTTIIQGRLRSLQATVSINVTESNDPPLFTMPPSITIIEDQLADNVPFSLGNFVTGIMVGPATARDELFPRQEVTFTVTALNQPTGLMIGDAIPQIDKLGRLTMNPAPDAFGIAVYLVTANDNDPTDPRTTAQTLTVNINPVNDPPVALTRTFAVDEAVEADGGSARIDFMANDLLGVGSLTPDLAGDFESGLSSLYDESEQTLRVVAFNVPGAASVDVASLPGGSGTVTRTTTNGGRLSFTFVSGAFTAGSYTPAADYNQRTPFAANDLFSYIISDDGKSSIPGSAFTQGTTEVRTLADVRSTAATVTITLRPVNDPPVYNSQAVINILERDDSGETIITGWATNVLPGPATALDELQRQTVSFTLDIASSTIPMGLFSTNPVVTVIPTTVNGVTTFRGDLSIFPNPDAVGSATIVITATDFEPIVGFMSRTTKVTFTINVQPVNDAPRVVSITPANNGPDEAYSVDAAGVITYTLKEDNTQAGGAIGTPFFIPLRQTPVVGYSKIGLLDPFNVGPANEADGTVGGSQVLQYLSVDNATLLGGTVVEVRDGSNTVIGFNYTPPVDYNNTIGNGIRGDDSFTFRFRDTNGGTETYRFLPAPAGLKPDPITVNQTVKFRLNPVNDRPQFTISTNLASAPLTVESLEDSGMFTRDGFATNIVSGPSLGEDEFTGALAQTVTFDVVALASNGMTAAQVAQQFLVAPRILPSGQLTFQTKPDVFGEFQFAITLEDSGKGRTPAENARGDLYQSLPQTITIDIQPVNDAPTAIPPASPNADPLTFNLAEDGTFEIPLRTTQTTAGILDQFIAGPANEVGSIPLNQGGSQTLSLATPLPTTTSQFGTLTVRNDALGNPVALIYRPKLNFTGRDTFTFTVTDNGFSIDLFAGNTGHSDPKTITGTVTLNVAQVNDAPQFNPVADVSSDEDAGLVTVANWATGIQVGPSDAVDEINGNGTVPPQIPHFVFRLISSTDPNLFVTGPGFETGAFANIIGSTAALQYTTRPDANGSAVFEVQLFDNGLDTGANVNFSIPRTFTITVNAVNDPPTFTPGGSVTVAEDSGNYDQPWAMNVFAGAANESAQTISFRVDTPLDKQPLFSVQPAIDSSGRLTFTPAADANGSIDLSVTAIDSLLGESQTVTLRVTITAVNDRPVGGPDFIQSAIINGVNQKDVNEDSVIAIQASALLANDSDADTALNSAESLRLQLQTAPLTTLGATIIFDPVTKVVFYDPRTSARLQALAPGQTAIDTFTYQVVDQTGAASTDVLVTIRVEGINDAPTAVSDLNVVVSRVAPTVLNILDNDFDVDGTIVPTSIVITLQPTGGELSFGANGQVTYTPFPGFTGSDLFRYTVADNLGQQSEQATVVINGSNVPIGGVDNLTVRGSGFTNLNVLGNDVLFEGATFDLTTLRVVTQPTRGTALPQADGTIRYTPNPGSFGPDFFTYEIKDSAGRLSSPSRVNLNVTSPGAQNPDNPRDVNASGTVTAADALAIINRLNIAGNVRSVPIDPNEPTPPYYDVNGDGFISAADALDVIAEILRLDILRLSGQEMEGEFLISDPTQLASISVQASFNPSPITSTVRASDNADAMFGLALTDDSSNKTASTTYNDESDLIDLIDLIATESDDNDADESNSAVDSLFARFDDLN